MREAIIHIPHAEFEAVGLGAFVSLVHEAGLRNLTELACRSDGCLLVVTVATPVDGERLDELDRLVWWERLSGDADRIEYLCKVDFPAFDGGRQPLHGAAVSNDEIRVSDDGVDVTLVGAQEDLAREIDEYDEAGMSVLLRRIADYGGPRDTLDTLTARQREVLLAAHERGYFDVPRNVSTAEVADDLGLDPSTVAEHLQRAERNLIDELVP